MNKHRHHNLHFYFRFGHQSTAPVTGHGLYIQRYGRSATSGSFCLLLLPDAAGLRQYLSDGRNWIRLEWLRADDTQTESRWHAAAAVAASNHHALQATPARSHVLHAPSVAVSHYQFISRRRLGRVWPKVMWRSHRALFVCSSVRPCHPKHCILPCGVELAHWLCLAKLIDTGPGYYWDGWMFTDS